MIEKVVETRHWFVAGELAVRDKEGARCRSGYQRG
jgi:hypothetical protein